MTNPENNASAILVVTGMHRSGTSLIANYLHHCGLSIGTNLLVPSRHNTAGYYEDVDFIKFHDDILSAAGDSCYLETRQELFVIDEHHKKQARRILAEKSSQGVWGWKDPRTVLFLESWVTLCPEARFLFVYRRPEEVLRSLRKRRDSKLFVRFPKGKGIFRYFKAIWLWCQYNQRILDFMDKYPKKCLLLFLNDITTGKMDILEKIKKHWGVQGLKETPLSEVFDPNLLTHKASTLNVILCRITPGVQRIQERLNHLKCKT